MHLIGEQLYEIHSPCLRIKIGYHKQYKQSRWGIKPNCEPEVDADRLDGMILAYAKVFYI